VYSPSAAQAKLCEISLVLAPIVSRLDFTASAHDCEEVQKEAVRAVRSCLNIVSFATWRGVDRGRTGRTDSALKLAINGQGQCHGVSSTMAAFLYPFTKVLGIDLKYRGGYTFYSSEACKVHNSPERHQWLELTFRPSMSTVICDLWLEDTSSKGPDSRFLTLPMEVAYKSFMYPNGALLLGSKPDPD